MHKNQPTFESLTNEKQEFEIQTGFYLWENLTPKIGLFFRFD